MATTVHEIAHKSSKAPKTNRLKASIWTEEGARHQIEGRRYDKAHMLAIYRLIIGALSKEQIARISAVLDEPRSDDAERR